MRASGCLLYSQGRAQMLQHLLGMVELAAQRLAAAIEIADLVPQVVLAIVRCPAVANLGFAPGNRAAIGLELLAQLRDFVRGIVVARERRVASTAVLACRKPIAESLVGSAVFGNPSLASLRRVGGLAALDAVALRDGVRFRRGLALGFRALRSRIGDRLVDVQRRARRL